MTELCEHVLFDPRAQEGWVEVPVPNREQTRMRPNGASGPQRESGPRARGMAVGGPRTPRGVGSLL